MLSDREQEIEELNFVLNDPGSHFLLVSGPPGATFRSYFFDRISGQLQLNSLPFSAIRLFLMS
jgi:hypothetical protein